MKHLCLCSARAFEVFVKEIAGVTLKRPHPPTPTLHVRRTRIGPTSSLRHFASSRVTASDDRSITVDKSSEDSNTWSATLEDGGPVEGGQELQRTSKDHFRDGWHAEVDIMTPSEQKVEVSTTELAEADTSEPAAQDASRNAKFVDNAAVDDLPEDETAIEHGIEVPLLPPDALTTLVAASGSHPPNIPAGSRVESRLQRKLRRIEAGTYMRKDKKPVPKEQGLEAQTKSILKFMKAARADWVAESGEQEEPPKKIRDPKRKATKGVPNLMNVTEKQSTAIGNDIRAKVTPGVTQDLTSKPSTAHPRHRREPWQVQKNALREKFGDMGWQPRKRLSPDTLEGVRALHASDPDSYTTPILAEHFKVTPEAIRRILRSKWQPSENEIEDRRNRWERRGERKWEAMAAQGVHPPAKWRAKGIKNPQVEKKRNARRVGDAHVRWDDRSLASVGPSLASRIA